MIMIGRSRLFVVSCDARAGTIHVTTGIGIGIGIEDTDYLREEVGARPSSLVAVCREKFECDIVDVVECDDAI